MKGTICLYQGEELGLTEAYVPYKDLQDPYGKRFWPEYKGRDGCCTPMPWTSDGPNGGFSDGKPWLPVAMEYLERAVSEQSGNADSTLSTYRQLIAFRKAHPVLQKGDLELVEVRDDFLAFIRHDGESRMFCAFNFSNAGQALTLPPGTWREDLGTLFRAVETEHGLSLPPYQAYFGIETSPQPRAG